MQIYYKYLNNMFERKFEIQTKKINSFKKLLKMKSCKYIEDSLYIAPNEIRSCCQRFFYEGEIRGDAKLTDLQKGQSPSQIDIKAVRKVCLMTSK